MENTHVQMFEIYKDNTTRKDTAYYGIRQVKFPFTVYFLHSCQAGLYKSA